MKTFMFALAFLFCLFWTCRLVSSSSAGWMIAAWGFNTGVWFCMTLESLKGRM